MEYFESRTSSISTPVFGTSSRPSISMIADASGSQFAVPVKKRLVSGYAAN